MQKDFCSAHILTARQAGETVCPFWFPFCSAHQTTLLRLCCCCLSNLYAAPNDFLPLDFGASRLRAHLLTEFKPLKSQESLAPARMKLSVLELMSLNDFTIISS